MLRSLRSVMVSCLALLLVWAFVVGVGAATKVPTVRFLLQGPGYSPMQYETGLMFKENLEALGLDIDLWVNSELSTYYNEVKIARDWGIAAYANVARPERLDPDAILYSMFHSSGAVENGNNVGRYVSPIYDALLEAQRTAIDPEKRLPLVWACNQQLAVDVPAIPLYHLSGTYAYNIDVFKNWVPMIGLGAYNTWNMVTVEPVDPSVDTFKIGNTAELETLNPLASTLFTVIQNLDLIYDTLFKIAPDASVKPWAATSFEVVNDTTIKVNLREGMTFHDGVPVTAEHVAFSYEYCKEWKLPPFGAPYLVPIESIEVEDDYTFVFHLSYPYAPFSYLALTQIPIIPKHIWENVVTEQGLDDPTQYPNFNPVGSGPFKFVMHVRDEVFKLERFEGHHHEPKVKFYEHIPYASEEVAFQAVRTGEVYTTVYKMLAATAEVAKTLDILEVVQVPDYGVRYYWFNQEVAPFDDVAFRKAICHALDWDYIEQKSLGGYGERGSGFTAPANAAWHWPGQDAFRDREFSFDMELARVLLEKAGYSWNAQGKLMMPE